VGPFEHDRYLVDQLVRPIVNLFRITPLDEAEQPVGAPVAYVRQKRMAVKEHIRFFADEGETREVFHIQGRSWLDTGGSRYDVNDAQDGHIGVLSHIFGKSLLRSTWRISTPDEQEIAVAHERSQSMALLRRVIDFVPDIGGLIPIPYNFDILADGEVIGHVNRKFNLRDQYVLDLSRDPERKLDRRLGIVLAVGLDTLQNR
jgi:uncharacterized protein YxjI